MVDISKFIPKMPTLEQHKAASAKWLSHINPCLYENWPTTLKLLSFKTTLIEVTREEQTGLLTAFDDGSIPQSLINKVNVELNNFKSDVFVKLSSRSPKDSWTDNFKCRTTSDVFSLLCQSERILDDLIEYKYADCKCYLLLREWVDIPKSKEWRCFIKQGRVIGITQYFYDEEFVFESGIKNKIITYLEEKILPILHLETVVVDLWMKESPVVIEINPYGTSDPCLLTYSELASTETCIFRTKTNINS